MWSLLIVMKNLPVVCLCLMVLVAILHLPVMAIEVTEQQWQKLSESKKVLSLEQINQLAPKLDTSESIWSASQLIKTVLGEIKPKAKHLHQLNKWRRSTATLSVNLQGTLVEKVNIGNEASAAIREIRAKAKANQLYELWQSNQFDIAEFEKLQGDKNAAVFAAFFNRLAPVLQSGFADWSRQKVSELKQSQPGGLNYLFTHMANRLSDVELAEYVLKQPVNAASKQFLASLNTHFEQHEVLELLLMAMEQKGLRTDSMKLLAVNFAENKRAAAEVARAMTDDSSYWDALTVMPAFISADNRAAFEAVLPSLSTAHQKQVTMRLQTNNR